MMSNTTLYLVDGSSYLYRAFHALPDLRNQDGLPTGAIFGVINMLKRLLNEYQPESIAVVFDAKGATFRDELYAEYKANRPPMPNDLRDQLTLLHQIIDALGLPILQEKGVEADDVIGTLTQQATAVNREVVIFTGDKDFAQLVSDKVTLIDTMKNTVLDEAGIIAKFGVKPEQIIDYLTLMGDKVDNVPGVDKVGPKTAVKWLTQYGSLDNIIESAEKIKGKVGENLRTALPQLPISKQLVTICQTVELPCGIDDLQKHVSDNTALRSLYQQCGFRQWLAEVSDSDTEDSIPEQVVQMVNYETVLTAEALATWVKRLQKADTFAFDTETNGLAYLEVDLIGVSFAVDAYHAAYVPVAHDYLAAPAQLSREEVLQALKPILEDESKVIIGQNLKFDAHILLKYGIQIKAKIFDTMLASYVLNSTATRHNMDALALAYLNVETISFESIAGKGKKQLLFNQIDLEQAAPYAAEDADITLRLYHALNTKLQADTTLLSVFNELEIPLLPVLAKMEQEGIKIDANLLHQQSTELTQRLQVLETKAFELAGQEFNLNSPKQLQAILFEKLALPVIKKTPKGVPSTAEDVLHTLAEDYPLPAVITEHRSLSKLKSTYIDSLPQQINSHTGRVHTSYHQAVTATGRLSSSEPNLQNIPIRTEEGRRIRQAFIVPENYMLVAADYSQIELRIMAHLSNDSALVGAFKSGKDVHTHTASEVFEVDVDAVTKDQRRKAKAVNFGLIYGMSAFGLAKQLDVERGEAQEYIDRYFARYPDVAAFMGRMRRTASEKGYVETVFGRRLHIPDINSKNGQRRQYAERSAINAPMQGTAADIIKKAMIDVDKWITESGADVKMLLQVHDELVFEIHQNVVESSVQAIKAAMENAVQLHVPLLVEADWGKNWDEAH